MIAIGDIHGCAAALKAIDPRPDDTLITLGDYVDRGIDSKGVLGHTPHREVLNVGHLICLDTGCGHGGWLTTLDIAKGTIWQADKSGRLK
ncbi:MAG TPA: hypothetical protein PK867_19615 [Pirellulales bacterium]|nr:hypothetical protein [Pirellulales bacterium]